MTDDVVFVHADESQARDRLRIFDQTLADHNVPRKVEKDVSVATEVVALGCHLGNSPPWVEPDLDKVVWTQQCALGIARRGRVTPRACSTVLGTMQWFCLVNRWLFSCFEEVYQFVDAANLDQDTVVPDGAVGELLLFSALAHFGVADLERLFLDIVVATDASPAFGFGLSVRACNRESTLDLAALSQQSSGFVLFNDVADLAADLQVHGVPWCSPSPWTPSPTCYLSVRGSRRMRGLWNAMGSCWQSSGFCDPQRGSGDGLSWPLTRRPSCTLS